MPITLDGAYIMHNSEYFIIDFETKSAADLLKAGADCYAQHITTDVLCMAYAQADGDVKLWIPGQPSPDDLLTHVAKGGKVIGHNISGFEMLIWNNVCGLKYDWPELKIEQCEDTMAMAYAMALPGSLNDASLSVGIDYKKDMKGHRVMLQLSQPRDTKPNGEIIWWDKSEVPEKYQKLYDYCKQDVKVERGLYKRLMRLSESEHKLWCLDWKINRRGVEVDIQSAKFANEIVAYETERMDLEIRQVTKGAVSMTTATGQLTDWLKSRGLEVPSVAKADVLELLGKEIPDDCKKALLLRQEAAKTSTAKLESMVRGASSGRRIRGLFQYHGASTGRWAGRRVQLQNLPRPKISQEQISQAFETINCGLPVSMKAASIRANIGSPMSVLSDCVRSFLKAKDGFDFIGCDFSAIEARVLAWLANEEKVLNIFRGEGKIYEHAASGIYRVPIETITKDQRQIGKVAVLALGYGGGKGAFTTMAKGYGVNVGDEQAEAIKTAWRLANPNIVLFWSLLEDAAIYAVRNPGKKFTANSITFLKNGSFLWCRLPSGRTLCYAYPQIDLVDTPWGDTREGLTYMGVDSFSKKWQRIKTYGGKLSENVTQAVARDILSDSLPRLEAKNYTVVMHVHDEVVCEVPKQFGSVEEVEQILSTNPPWARGLPLAAEGWRFERYTK